MNVRKGCDVFHGNNMSNDRDLLWVFYIQSVWRDYELQILII